VPREAADPGTIGIATGLLLDLKTTSAQPSLGIQEAFQLIERYAYLSTWRIDRLLDELAGCPVSLSATRRELRRLLPDRWSDNKQRHDCRITTSPM
jgi:hypothetical protein